MTYYIDSQSKIAIEFENNIKNIYYLDSKINNIYRAKIINKVKGVGVFLDIGNETAFTQEKVNGNEGESVIVKVVKIPGEEEKAVKVTTEISFTGKYLIVFDADFIKVSSKIAAKEKERLQNFAKGNSLKGVLIRTEASEVSEEILLNEYCQLKNKISDIKKEINKLPTPKLLYEEDVKTKVNFNIADEILFNDRELYKKYSNYENALLDKDFRIKYSPNLMNEINTLLSAEVKLSTGGNITFEKTRAFTVIDVNSKVLKGENKHEVTRITNIEAAREISRQILLRNISGVILIDFIDMGEVEKKEIIKIMISEMAIDGKSTTIFGFTKLGLLELSRKNKGPEFNKIWKG